MEISPVECGHEDEAFQRRKRRAEARLKLAFLPRHDRIVASYHGLEIRKDLRPAAIESWRQRRRDEYRRATGVEIEQRDALRARLEQIAETGDQSVDEAIDQLRQDYANGLALADGGSG